MMPAWTGRPLGGAVSVVLAIRSTDDCIVLCHPDAQRGRAFANLLRVSSSGAITWRAELPPGTGDDAFVNVRWEDKELMANTWSGHRVRIDPDSGRILGSAFTK
jgi:hypothetical protein